MKNFKWLLVVLIVFIGFSCSKTQVDPPDVPDVPGELTGMNAIDVPDGFDWKMKTDYQLVLTGGDSDVITVTNMDGTRTVFMGSYHENENGEYLISLTLPSAYTSIIVNSTEVSLSGDVINVDVSSLKSRSALKAFGGYTYDNGFGTLAFEDLYPGIGDHDFNDLVIAYEVVVNTVTISTVDYVESIDFNFKVKAHGADLSNGFAFELTGATFPIENYTIEGQGLYGTWGHTPDVNADGFENGQSHPTIIAFKNIDYVMEKWTNTNDGDGHLPYAVMQITLSNKLIFHADYGNTITLDGTGDNVDGNDNGNVVGDFYLYNFNPFIYIGQERGKELHLVNYPPTDLAGINNSHWGFGTWDDASEDGGPYYVSNAGLPWALDIPIDTWAWPIEERDISLAYVKFNDWVVLGTPLTWYDNSIPANVNDSYLYDDMP